MGVKDSNGGNTYLEIVGGYTKPLIAKRLGINPRIIRIDPALYLREDYCLTEEDILLIVKRICDAWSIQMPENTNYLRTLQDLVNLITS